LNAALLRSRLEGFRNNRKGNEIQKTIRNPIKFLSIYLVFYLLIRTQLIMAIQNDSPNGTWIDGLCLIGGAAVSATMTQLIYAGHIPWKFEYLTGFMMVALLFSFGILAIQKSKKIAFTPIPYAAMMTLLGWAIGTFIVVELHTK
jgi:hypothetical protein